ncbi:MAG: 3-deoxy-8-phosphooctulonate synthase [Gemmatimonadetes bacterium]|nr:MAG: 3-deoxy-8-phosphooctulonate synthase [Gemmatimonadota bacterium]
MGKTVVIDDVKIGTNLPLTIIAGPCVVENETIVFQVAEKMVQLTEKLGFPYIFKSSYKKANRTSSGSFITIGEEHALEILAAVKTRFGVPVLTDIHTEQEADFAAEYVDVLQIPAFLCRQTELLQAAGATGKAINIKKGQFLAPQDMALAAEKIALTGNENILLTERGTTFGYRDLVVDMRGLVIMAQSEYPVIYDATHSLQSPGGAGGKSGGHREFALPLARAAVATGCQGLFVETHPDPATAKSDAATQLPLNQMESLLHQVRDIHQIVCEYTPEV